MAGTLETPRLPRFLTYLLWPFILLFGILRSSCETPLHRAVRKGQSRVVKVLVNFGAKVDIENQAGLSPLHVAAALGYEKVAEALLDLRGDANKADKQGWMPIHHAAFKGHESLVAMLLNGGGEPNAQNGSGWTAMHLASASNKTSVLKTLHGKGAHLDDANSDGDTPLHIAASRGYLYTLFTLVKLGASANEKNKARKMARDLLSTTENVLDLMKQVVKDEEKTLKELQEKHAEDIRAKEEEMTSLKEDLEAQVREMNRKCSIRDTKIDGLQQDISCLKGNIREKEEKISSLQSQDSVIRGLELRLTEAERQYIEKVMDIRRMKENEAIEDKREADIAIEKRNRRIESLTQALTDKEDDIADKDSQIKLLEAKLAKLREEHELEKVEGAEPNPAAGRKVKSKPAGSRKDRSKVATDKDEAQLVSDASSQDTDRSGCPQAGSKGRRKRKKVKETAG